MFKTKFGYVLRRAAIKPIAVFLFWGMTHNLFAWVNPGFETGNLAGWTSATNSGGNVACPPSVSVVGPGPAINTVAGQLNEVQSGVNAVQLFSGRGDSNYQDWAQVSQTDTVPAGASCLSFWFAGIFEDYHYLQGDIYGDSKLQIDILIGGTVVATINYNWPNNLAQILYSGLTGNGNYAACNASGNFDWGYVPWTNYTINLSAYAGQQATLRATMYDCDAGGHYGVAYLDNVSWSTCVPSTVQLTKSHNPTGAVAPGGTITYTLSYSNPGTQGVAGVEVNDTIPTGTNLVAGSIGANPPLPFTNQIGSDIIWNVGYLGPGASGSVSFAVKSPGCSQGPVTNIAKETDLDGGDLLSNLVINQVWTCTPTPTNTSTMTNTSTSVPTNTSTQTNTPTNTFTSTNTSTSTRTNTVTNTFTHTATNTCTNTQTVANTSTNTPTNTNTNVNTATSTVTETFTNTRTSTATATTTPTSTNTYTPSATHTWTHTQTYTDTATQSSTSTASSTMTRTATNTCTASPTFSPTATPTGVMSIGKIVSQPQVAGGDILTYDIAVTVTGGSLGGVVVTDDLPPSMTFVSFVSSPNGTQSVFNTATDQLRWALPSPLSTGVYQLLYRTQVAASAPANAHLVNFAQGVFTGASRPVTASVPVTVLGQYTIDVNIYNSAGEVVKTIAIQRFGQPINNISLSATNRITTLQGPGSTIDILFQGVIIGTWNGSNNSGQPVSNGTYRVQVDSISGAGTVTSVSQQAIVNRDLGTLTVNIFNSAGELVRNLYASVADANAAGANTAGAVLGPNVLKPGATATTSQDAVPDISIVVDSGSGPVTLLWDGSNNQGTYVTPGGYSVQIHWSGGESQERTVVREVMVLSPQGQAGGVAIAPNVLGVKYGTTAFFDASSIAESFSIRVQLYTLSGERVATLTSPTGQPQVSWNAAGIASGIYVSATTVFNSVGGTIRTERHKVMVLR